MTENNELNTTEEKKKPTSLQELVKQQLEAKKNKGSGNQSNGFADQNTKKMKSQQTKKVSNTRRKMGV